MVVLGILGVFGGHPLNLIKPGDMIEILSVVVAGLLGEKQIKFNINLICIKD